MTLRLTVIALITLLTACASSPTPTQRAAEAVQTREPSLRKQAKALQRSDRAAAHLLYAQLCDAGDGDGCRMAAMMLHPEQVVDRAAFFSRSCELEFAKGCYNLAAAHWRGQGVDFDPHRAVEIVDQTCERGEALGCELAVAYREDLTTTDAAELREANLREGQFHTAISGAVVDVRLACEPEFDIDATAVAVAYRLTDDGRYVDIEMREEAHRGTKAEACFRRVLGAVRLPPHDHVGPRVLVYVR